VLAALLVFIAPALPAQQPPPGPPPGPPPRADTTEALRVYLDCSTWICDLDFLRTEITFVNYMRDRADAQVYVLVTTQRTGAGGTEYTLTFMGQGRFAGRLDTLVYTSQPTDVEDTIRRGIARALKLGFVRYVAGTPLADHLDVRFAPPGGPGGPTREQRDPWNYWVFTLSGRGWFNGEQQTSSQSLYGTVSANRTTERWKLRNSAYWNRDDNRYEYSYTDVDTLTGDTTVTTVVNDFHQLSYGASALLVRSAGAHWSVGGRAGVNSSTYNNTDLALSAAVAIEYSVFPYSESTRRLFLLNYSIGPRWVRYDEETIFFTTEETLLQHELEVSLDARQRWGETGVTLSASQYLDHPDMYNLGVFGSISLQLVRGLRFNLGGSYNVVRDQRFLPSEGATPEEILARQQQLATDYSYFFSVGLSYTFGSIYNNIVNPRFGNGGRTIFF
jgi:hypothetical protein